MANNNLGQESMAQGGIRLDALFVFTPPIKGLCKAKSGTNQPPNAYLPHCIKPLAQTEGQRPSTNVILSIHFLQHHEINPIYKQKALGCQPRQNQGP